MSAWFFQVDAWLIDLSLAAVLLAIWGIGRRDKASRQRVGAPSPTKAEEALLVLLGLLLAFSFGMAVDRHDRRRAVAVADANAIGDFYTTTRLLDEPVRGQLHEVVREYVELRLAIAREGSRADLEGALKRVATLHDAMTRLVGEAVQEASRAPVDLVLVQTLNGLTSSHAARLMAIRDHLAGEVVLLLFAASVLGIVILRRIEGPRSLALLAFVALVSFLVFVILDLNQPRRGFILVSQEPMERLQSAIQANDPPP